MLPDKPSLDELEHFGVKGMRWGVRKSYPSKTEIKTARRNVQAQRAELTGNRIATTVRTVQGNKKAVGQLKARRADLKAAYLNNPDRITALKLTKGEAAVHAIFLVSGVGVVPVATSIVSREVIGRSIAKRQGRDPHTLKKK